MGEKRQSVDSNTEITERLELSDDFKAGAVGRIMAPPKMPVLIPRTYVSVMLQAKGQLRSR